MKITLFDYYYYIFYLGLFFCVIGVNNTEESGFIQIKPPLFTHFVVF